MKPGDEVYWFSEKVTLIRREPDDEGEKWWLVQRHGGGTDYNGDPILPRQQVLAEVALTSEPNYGLQEVIRAYEALKRAILLNPKSSDAEISVRTGEPEDRVRNLRAKLKQHGQL